MQIDKIQFHNFRKCNFNTKHHVVSVPHSLLNYFKYQLYDELIKNKLMKTVKSLCLYILANLLMVQVELQVKL